MPSEFHPTLVTLASDVLDRLDWPQAVVLADALEESGNPMTAAKIREAVPRATGLVRAPEFDRDRATQALHAALFGDEASETSRRERAKLAAWHVLRTLTGRTLAEPNAYEMRALRIVRYNTHDIRRDGQHMPPFPVREVTLSKGIRVVDFATHLLATHPVTGIRNDYYLRPTHIRAAERTIDELVRRGWVEVTKPWRKGDPGGPKNAPRILTTAAECWWFFP